MHGQVRFPYMLRTERPEGDYIDVREEHLGDGGPRQCLDCAIVFPFTAEEALFYDERGFRPPVRCSQCRASRRAERNADLIRAFGHRDTALVSGGHGTYGGAVSPPRSAVGFSRGGTGRGPNPQALHSATCAACGKETRIPFEPRGGRPVYCRECFNARRNL